MDNKCRICLKLRKRIHSIYTRDNGVTFADMMTAIANTKIEKDDICPFVCVSCCRQLRQAYKLKDDIERSDSVLQEQNNVKKGVSNTNDIFIVIDIDPKPIIPVIETQPAELFKYGESIVTYNDITIKKVKTEVIKNEDSNEVRKSLSVQEFLSSIKLEESADGAADAAMGDESAEYDEAISDDGTMSDDGAVCDGSVGIDSDAGSNYSLELRHLINKKKKVKKRVKKKGKNKENKPKENQSELINCKGLMPEYLNNIRMLPNRKTKKRDPKPISSNICPYCGKSVTNLNTHILTHAENTKKFKCDKCDKSYYILSSLRKHALNHLDNRAFKCLACVATFVNKSALVCHMKMHSEEKNHICHVCSQAYKRKSALRRHLMTHNLGVKPISCDLCSLRFYTKYALQHHMRIHTRERPYKCEICSQPYSYKRDFNRHCMKKHGVLIDRRPVNVMNEEVLQRERSLMKELLLKANGVLNKDEVPECFEGPQAALAYEQTMKKLKTMQTTISF